ncbi:ABC transporter substrate-binding protein [Terracoccus luteus]|jgi:polar amino acid transport system substrate-binding protein|uniref:Polar amino acid transport system substrate-binding protein n=1 Tax=Terracoccus luteus TaxID=53356 RepID=A0A495Y402_9MICO|nr:ABC transporter substrate-binding protein [Terracoccus luteus]MBB2987890.1 polar amino acid transport system substrate-binding protein [Terracoccus luteus]MCP2173541.1 polar amino acid transport system substrate-binding protein [Terracoccus luteus]RKT80003.1 polar amino acid transport system substrate-binding protein [Terracoccus luteus]
MRRMSLIALTGVAVAGLSLSACGSDSMSTSPGAGSTPVGSGSAAGGGADATLAAKVPADLKSAGKIVVGTDPTYAPNEMLASDGKTVEGFDPALFDAVAAKLGLKTEYVPAGFDSIILGVTGGKYDVGVSSFTINDDRKKQVNMVSYYSAGTQWVVQKGNPDNVNADDACGKSIGVQKGTVQVDDLTARSKKCTDAGKQAINPIVQEGQDQVTADLASGKTVAMLADSPVGLYAVKQTGGALEALGDIYDSAPYGIVVPKNDTALADLLVEALKATKADGSYEAALKKYAVEAGAIDDFAVNP